MLASFVEEKGQEMASGPTLWDVAQAKRKQSIINGGDDSVNVMNETHLLVCGTKDSGKTTLIQKFLDRDEPPKPTIALDFCYARKAKQNNMAGVKDVANISELGGGKSTVKLLDAIISKNNVSNLVVVLVLDLSKPNDIWVTQEAILNQVKQRISVVINEEKKNKPELEKDLMRKAWQRVGAVHTDKNMISPLLAPLVIIGTKYDLFQEMNNNKKEMVSKALRFIAHYYGGMIQFFSTKAEGLSARSKAVFSHLSFKTSLSKTISIDPGKPLIIPFGSDSLEQVGAPPVSADRLMKGRGSSPYELWKNAYESIFPYEQEGEDSKKDPGKDKSFADETIDNIRALKDQELERQRKLNERKAKENQLNASVGAPKNKQK